MRGWTTESQNINGTTGGAHTYSYRTQTLSVMYPDEQSITDTKAKIASYLNDYWYNKAMNFSDFLESANSFSIIQAENPDGDSLGSALALDYLIAELYPNKTVSLYCPVEIPKYLRYFSDWSRISADFDFKSEAYIIVDTASAVLLSKLLEDSAIQNLLAKKPVFVFDHHESPDDLPFPHTALIEPLPSCCNLIYQTIKDSFSASKLSPVLASNLCYGILSDTLGLTSASTTPETFRDVAALLEQGRLNIADLEENRRAFMKKSQRILNYKADLIKRTEYLLDGTVATVHIPWEEIEQYSYEYNPNVLILEELRMVEGVELAVAVKTYPDGKVTGKIRSSLPLADQLAAFYGGGGHPYAAGFRTYDLSYQEIQHDLIEQIPKLKAALPVVNISPNA